MSDKLTGGRNKTAAKSALETTLKQIDKTLADPNTPAQVIGRLLQSKSEILAQERKIETEAKRDRFEEKLAEQNKEIVGLKAEIEALKSQPAVVVNSSTDSFLSSQVDGLRGRLDGAQQRIKQLESELSAEKSNYQREVAAVKAENEQLRSDAAYGRETRKRERIEVLRRKIMEYDARLLLPNMGIDPKMPKQQFEQLMAAEKADRDELDELLGIKQPEPKTIPLPPDAIEARKEQAQRSAQWNLAYARSAAESANQQADLRGIPRHSDASILLYGTEPVPEGWD